MGAFDETSSTLTRSCFSPYLVVAESCVSPSLGGGGGGEGGGSGASRINWVGLTPPHAVLTSARCVLSLSGGGGLRPCFWRRNLLGGSVHPEATAHSIAAIEEQQQTAEGRSIAESPIKTKDFFVSTCTNVGNVEFWREAYYLGQIPDIPQPNRRHCIQPRRSFVIFFPPLQTG